MIVVKPMAHGVYVGYADGRQIVLAVRCCPVEAAYITVRFMLRRCLETQRRNKARAGPKLTPRLDRPTYKKRKDRYWYLHEDDLFHHWHPRDHCPPRHRRYC